MNIPELVVNAHCIIGEGPIWDERTQSLYFIDILGKSLYCFDGKYTQKKITFDQSLGFAVLRESGGVIAGLEKGFYAATFNGQPAIQIIDPEPERKDGRFNDGKVDPAGRVWGGTMPVSLDTGYGKAGPDSAVYCLDQNGHVKTMLTGVIQSNGMGWNKDATKFYFIDTQKFCVQAFDYDMDKNELSNGRICVAVPAEMGIPDGMTVDDEGKLWVALWGGGAVCRWDPQTGKLLQRINLPALNVTSCCFGGKHMDKLFVTTASLNTDMNEYPHAGGVFRIDAGVTGAASYRYGG